MVWVTRAVYSYYRHFGYVGTTQTILRNNSAYYFCFFKGGIYELTYNDTVKFSNIQSVILFDLPSQDDLDKWLKIKVLVETPGMNGI